jgi:hypothetical protein
MRDKSSPAIDTWKLVSPAFPLEVFTFSQHGSCRLCVTVQEVTQLREDKAHLEKQTRDLQAKCSASENEKYEAITRARESMQLLEEANLEKSQVGTPAACPCSVRCRGCAHTPSTKGLGSHSTDNS